MTRHALATIMSQCNTDEFRHTDERPDPKKLLESLGLIKVHKHVNGKPNALWRK
jgi:hypothetical protein